MNGQSESKSLPDGLISNDDPRPLLLGDDVGNSGELSGDNIDGLVGLALLETLTNAEDDAQAGLDGGLGLAGNELQIDN